jgi:ribose 5-phosphate isomerase A
METQERLRILAARAAAIVQPGMVLGLGSGTTAEAFVRALSERVRGGLNVTGVATSSRTARLASELGIPLVEIDEIERLDLGIDGADEIDPNLNLVKGRGGALLWEKLVAQACDDYFVIAASEKLVDRLGTRTPVPVEIISYGWAQTAARVESLGCEAHLRFDPARDAPFVTDGGHFIVDCATGPILDPESFAYALKAVTGVVDHGLFIGIADWALTVDGAGIVSEHRAPGD